MILSLKQIVAISMLCVFLGATFVWGLKVGTPTEESAETDGGGIVVEASHFPLKLTMMLNKTVFKVGEPVNMTFYVENIGNETLTMVYGKDYVSFIVYDENGSKVYEREPGYLMIYIFSYVEPGFAFVVTYTWYQKYGLIYQGLGSDPPAYYKKVPPGTYKIVGLFISGTLNITMETPPITITITS